MSQIVIESKSLPSNLVVYNESNGFGSIGLGFLTHVTLFSELLIDVVALVTFPVTLLVLPSFSRLVAYDKIFNFVEDVFILGCLNFDGLFVFVRMRVGVISGVRGAVNFRRVFTRHLVGLVKVLRRRVPDQFSQVQDEHGQKVLVGLGHFGDLRQHAAGAHHVSHLVSHHVQVLHLPHFLLLVVPEDQLRCHLGRHGERIGRLGVRFGKAGISATLFFKRRLDQLCVHAQPIYCQLVFFE